MRRLFVAALVVAASLVATPAFAAAPSNDDFENAMPLPMTVGGEPMSTYEATRQPGEPLHAGLQMPQSVWFTYTAAKTEYVLVFYPQTWDRSGPTGRAIAVYRGSALGALQQLGADRSPLAHVTWQALAGETYRIALAGGGSDKLELRHPWAPLRNDDFADALPLRVPDDYQGNIIDATAQRGDPAGAQSVWFRLRVPRSMVVTIVSLPDPVGGGWCDEPPTYAYTGSRLSALRTVPGPDWYSARFLARAKTTYHVKVMCHKYSPAMTIKVTVSGEPLRGHGLYASSAGTPWERASVGAPDVKSLRRSGFRFMLGSWLPCRVRLGLRVSGRTARALRLPTRWLTPLIYRQARPSGADVTLRLTRAASNALAGRKALRATLVASVPGSRDRHDTLTVPIRFR